MKISQSNIKNVNSTDCLISKKDIMQGYFMDEMVKGVKEDMELKFQAVKKDVDYLKHKESEFRIFNSDELDHGQLYDYLVSTARGAQKVWVPEKVRKAGIAPSKFSSALDTVGRELATPNMKKKPLRLDLESIKRQEIQDEASGGVPVSPRHRSRLIQIPNLVALITDLFSKNTVLKNFDFILGGGSALTLKHPDEGRLGRPSENMRDIDMDFQAKKSADAAYSPTNTMELTTLIGSIKDAMVQEMAKLAGSTGALLIAKPSITNGKTIIFKSFDLEYSFHFIDKKTETTLISEKMNSPDAGKFNVINDASHWSMTMSALKARLSRPDKIHKTLMDALVLARKSEVRLNDINSIIVENAMHIVDVKKALSGLYLKRGTTALDPEAGSIGGLEAEKARGVSGNLDAIKNTFLESRILSDNEIISARNTYLNTIVTILDDIASKSDSAERPQIKSNVEKLKSRIGSFRKWIRGYEHYVKIPKS